MARGLRGVDTRSGDVWSQQDYLKANNAGANDHFGSSIALSKDGHTLAVGAPAEDHLADAIFNAGATYIFTRSGGHWSQQAYLTASNLGWGDHFGYSLSLSADGNRLAVGALGESSSGSDDPNNDDHPFAGAAYVFDRSGAAWAEQAYLKASVPDRSDRFGHSLALSSDGRTLAVGADREDGNATGASGTPADQLNNSVSDSGAVYVFANNGLGWFPRAYLKASNPDADDRFGSTLALSENGDRLLVGAHGERSKAMGLNGDATDNSLYSAGAAYAFTRSAGAWSLRTYIKASNTGKDDRFGAALALSADGMTAVVAAWGEASKATGIDGDQLDDSQPHAGAVYLLNTLR